MPWAAAERPPTPLVGGFIAASPVRAAAATAAGGVCGGPAAGCWGGGLFWRWWSVITQPQSHLGLLNEVDRAARGICSPCSSGTRPPASGYSDGEKKTRQSAVGGDTVAIFHCAAAVDSVTSPRAMKLCPVTEKESDCGGRSGGGRATWEEPAYCTCTYLNATQRDGMHRILYQ